MQITQNLQKSDWLAYDKETAADSALESNKCIIKALRKNITKINPFCNTISILSPKTGGSAIALWCNDLFYYTSSTPEIKRVASYNT